ncbi:MAG: hypothetical protein V8T38_00020 [Oscillospiraceae bacterium]
MTYLSTAEVAEIKGCTPQYVRRLVQNGKLTGETKDNAANNRTEYMIPLTALPQDLQLKWENQQRRSLGLEPVKKAVKAPLKTESTRLTLDDLTDKQRSELYLWTGIIKDWLTIRDSYEQYSKGEIDEMFVQAARLKYPDLEISTDILYRQGLPELGSFRAYRQEGRQQQGNDRRSGVHAERVQPVLPRSAVPSNNELLPIHPGLGAGVHYPESLPDMPSERTFRRRAEDIPYAVQMYFRNGDKAFSDKCLPYVERLYDDLHANDVWIADNHTFDFFTAGKDGKVSRLYLTAFLNARIRRYDGLEPDLCALRRQGAAGAPARNTEVWSSESGVLRQRFRVPCIGYRWTRKNLAAGKTGTRILCRRTSCSSSGIEMHNAIVRNAKAKPIERTFCTFKNQFSRCIPAFCGGTILERPESLKYKLKHGIIPEEEQIRIALDSSIDGCFNAAPYGGKERRYKGMRRFEVWNSSIQDVDVFRQIDEANLSMLLETRQQAAGGQP